MQCIQLAPYKGEESPDAQKVGDTVMQKKLLPYQGHRYVFNCDLDPIQLWPWSSHWLQTCYFMGELYQLQASSPVTSRVL